MALGLAIAGAGALMKGITGALQARKANQIDKANQLPIQNVQNEYFQNVADAENMARVGMPKEQYNLAINNLNRNMAGGLRRLGGSNQSLASMIRAGNDSTLRLDANNANDRTRNRLNLFQQRNILAGQKNSVFDWNKKQPYIANLAKAEALRGAGMQNAMSAFSDLSQGGMMLAANAEGGGSTSGMPPQGGSAVRRNWYSGGYNTGVTSNGYNS